MTRPRPVLALDVGERRIGVAVSDPTGTLASPRGVILRRGGARDAAALRERVRDLDAGLVVVGLPLSLSGGVGPQARRVQAFVDDLRGLLDVPVETWDERFSTAEAEAVLREQGVRQREVRRRIDEVAAAIILQSYLDAHREGSGPAGARMAASPPGTAAPGGGA